MRLGILYFVLFLSAVIITGCVKEAFDDSEVEKEIDDIIVEDKEIDTGDVMPENTVSEDTSVEEEIDDTFVEDEEIDVGEMY